MSAQGKFVWHDLMTTDVEASKRFYGELFGWRIWKGEHGDYLHISAGKRDIGGIVPPDPKRQMPSHWNAYIAAQNIDEVMGRVTEAGGKVYAPVMDIPRVGKFAVVADPRGATFSPFQAIEWQPDDDKTPAPGEFCWDELLTDDPEAAVAFYEKVFGHSHTAMDMGPMGTYRVLKLGEKNAGGIMKMPPGAPHPPMWLPYVSVESADQTAARVAGLGGVVYAQPMDIPDVGRFAVLGDNTQASIAILQPPR
jgi:uncharacterized protein